MRELRPHQQEALDSLDNGRILYGGTGSGKSATAMAYYSLREAPRDIYVITTAKKRDSLDWDGEAASFGISRERASSRSGKLTVDSWNNIGKYEGIRDSFFIFDEQRLVGTGSWVKSFLKLSDDNHWILLSATPGDVWLDYAPVFIANGWYRNITDFKRQHVVYAPFVKYPKILRYIGTSKLERLRNEVLVEMPYDKHTTRIINYIPVGYDKDLVKKTQKERWNPYVDAPVTDIAELWRVVRQLVHTDPSRLAAVQKLLEVHPRLIVFYNYNYELEVLRTLSSRFDVYEWNGHKHEEVPGLPEWVYLVQYTAGSEGWNCTSTDAMCFYSLTYSYKNYAQAQGRIDRLNTSYTNLYYYILESSAYIDLTLRNYLSTKRDFNERAVLAEWEAIDEN